MLRMMRTYILRHETLIIAAALAILLGGVLMLWFAFLDLPDINVFDDRVVTQSTKIYDRTGEVLLYDLQQNVKRTVVSYDDISRHVKNATVAIEDADFYKHHGVRPLATLRALFIQPLRGYGIQGGSTITQQVVKNSLLTPERKISRKLKEWALAIKLEKKLSKEEILTLYLNEVPYGGSIYGVEQAAQTFFGKPASDLTIAESAYLAALPQAPTYYSPYGDHRDELEDRKNLVLKRMHEEKFITDDELLQAQKEDVSFRPPERQSIKAPHFVFYVQSYLENKYGPRALQESGLTVISTLDWELQKEAERIVYEHALENKDKFNAENAGIVAVDPRTGQILVMVGSRDYFDKDIDGNFNITLAHRQPGSSFKPIVYAAALNKGYTPETVVFDLRTQFSTTCSPQNFTSEDGCYSPQNYDNTFRGPVTFRDALAQSINVPAVKVLYLVGIENALRLARSMGIESLEAGKEQYGLTLVLGGGEVTPLEMAGAYSIFADDGIRHAPTAILSIKDSNGETLEQFNDAPQQVLDKQIARQISDMLSDNVARTPAFGANSYLYFPGRDVAVKTGTTDDYRDAWIIGYTPSISVAAWAGNNDNSPMVKKVAGFIVAPMWNEFMQKALGVLPQEQFPEPLPIPTDISPRLRGIWKGGQAYTIDSVSGKLATEFTPIETQEEHVIENVHSILHWIDKDNPRGGIPSNPAQDPQYSRWEVPVQAWALARGFYTGSNSSTPTLSGHDTVHTSASMPELSISGIENNKTYDHEDTLTIRVRNDGKFPLQRAELYVNQKYFNEDTSSPFSFSIHLADMAAGDTEIRIVGTDSVYNKAERTFTITIK